MRRYRFPVSLEVRAAPFALLSMQITEPFETAPFDPKDPNPWLALYLDMSLPLSDEVKAALLANSGSKSRQFVLPLIRPMAKLSMMFLQVLKVFIPNRFTSSRVLHRSIYWGLRNFVRPMMRTISSSGISTSDPRFCSLWPPMFPASRFH